MILKDKRTGKKMPCSKQVWEKAIVANGKEHLFEVIQDDENVQPIARKSELSETLAPKRRGRKAKEST